jgi:hypothetical protein
MRTIGTATGAGLLVVGALLLSGCQASPPPGTGDPGNARLQLLVADPVFAVLPPDAAEVGSVKKTAAVWRGSWFEGSGWDGPSVTLTFISSQPPRSVFDYFGRRATETGWRSTGAVNGLGYGWSWRKTLVDGAAATLSLFAGEVRTGSGGRSFQLIGSAATI